MVSSSAGLFPSDAHLNGSLKCLLVHAAVPGNQNSLSENTPVPLLLFILFFISILDIIRDLLLQQSSRGRLHHETAAKQ